MEGGEPFFMFKDNINRKNNQVHDGLIVEGSNLCLEIVQVTRGKDENDKETKEIATCNLGSIAVDEFITEEKQGGRYDFKALAKVVYFMIHDLHQINKFSRPPRPEAKTSDDKYNALGLGVQGVHDLFMKMDYLWESEEAGLLLTKIYACMYHSALRASRDISLKEGPHKMWKKMRSGSGLLQMDLWKLETEYMKKSLVDGGIISKKNFEIYRKPHYDDIIDPSEFGFIDELDSWDALRNHGMNHGFAHSLLRANMPTASSAQIMDKTESFEPRTMPVYNRRVLSGEFICVDQYLVKDLKDIGLWGMNVQKWIISQNGSIQGISKRFEKIANCKHGNRLRWIEEKYKNVFEISQKWRADLMARTGRYVDQSSSFNINMADSSYEKIMNLMIQQWVAGNKTGGYYFRTLTKENALKFSLDSSDDCLFCQG